jgi:hypothetical protein
MTRRPTCACLLVVALVAGCGATSTAPPASIGTAPIPTSAAATPPATPVPVTPTPAPSIVVLESVVDAPTVIDVPTAVVSDAVVGASGGSVAADGVQVAVPEGGVASDTKVSVSRLEAPFRQGVFAPVTSTDASAIAIGKAYDLGPSGTTFAQPVDVTLPYDPANIPAGGDPASISVAYFTGTHWATAGGVVDPVAHTVTVRVKAFEGEIFTTIFIATVAGAVINRAIKWAYGGEGVKSDPISEKKAQTYVTPDDPAVRDAAAKAKAGGVPLSDPAKLAKYLADHKDTPVPVSFVGPDGAPVTPTYSTSNGSNWQMPADYLTKGQMKGDCTDVTSATVSMFRALGYPAKAVFGYVVDKDSPHVWGEVQIGGKPYLIDEEGKLQPLDDAMTSMHLIRPDPSDPRAAMWDENGQQPYEADWWSNPIDANGKWSGTFTVTDVTIDPALKAEAEKEAADQGCDLTSALEQLVGKALPMTLDISVDGKGKGTAVTFIDYSSVKDAKGKPLSSKPSTAEVTYVGNRLTFVGESSGAGSTMTGTASRSGNTLTIRGTLTGKGKGYSMTGVWSVSRNE